MSTQDKEMDELFRSKLDNIEVAPSERVWKGIVVELDGAKQKGSLASVLRIAAGIAVIVTAGLFFVLKDAKVDQYQAVNNVKKQRSNNGSLLENTHMPDKGDKRSSSSISGVTPLEPTGVNDANKSVIQSLAFKAVSKKRIPVTRNTSEPEQVKQIEDDVLPLQLTAGEQQNLAAVTGGAVEFKQAVVPDMPLNTANTKEAENDAPKVTLKAVTASLEPVKRNQGVTKKHGIRSLGDLINVVVAKVDKRQDKVIEFSNTDDDEATLTGINLGFVKVKKEK